MYLHHDLHIVLGPPLVDHVDVLLILPRLHSLEVPESLCHLWRTVRSVTAEVDPVPITSGYPEDLNRSVVSSYIIKNVHSKY